LTVNIPLTYQGNPNWLIVIDERENHPLQEGHLGPDARGPGHMGVPIAETPRGTS